MSLSLKEKIKALIQKGHSEKDQENEFVLRNQIALLKKGYESLEFAGKFFEDSKELLEASGLELAKNDHKLKDQIAKLEKLDNEIQTTQELIHSNHSRLRTCKRDIADNTDEVNLYQNKIILLSDELHNQYDELKKIENEVEKVSVDKSEVKSKYEAIHHHYVKNKSRQLEQIGIIDRNNYLMDQLLKDIKSYQNEIDNLLREIVEKDIAISNQSKEFTQNQLTLQELSNELSIYQGRFKAIQYRISSNADKLREQKKKIAHNSKEIEHIQSGLNEAKHTLDLQLINIEENDTKVWEQRKWIDENVRVAHERRHLIQKNKDILRDQERIIENNLKQIHLAQAQINEEAVELNMQQVIIDSHKKEIEEIKIKLHDQGVKLNSQRDIQRENEIKMIRMASLSKTIKDALSKRNHRISELDLVLKQHEVEIESNSMVLAEQRKELKNKSQIVLELTGIIEEFERKINRQNEQIEKLSKQQDDQDSLIAKRQKEEIRLKEDIEVKAGFIFNLEDKIYKDRIKLSALRANVDDANGKLARYNICLEKLKQSNADIEQMLKSGTERQEELLKQLSEKESIIGNAKVLIQESKLMVKEQEEIILRYEKELRERQEIESSVIDEKLKLDKEKELLSKRLATYSEEFERTKNVISFNSKKMECSQIDKSVNVEFEKFFSKDDLKIYPINNSIVVEGRGLSYERMDFLRVISNIINKNQYKLNENIKLKKFPDGLVKSFSLSLDMNSISPWISSKLVA